ncbi:hypothetical protein [Donghicola sp. XS_ASV15]|uniref:hypothetical protein n=1 Tax=Donghicola sp. XS_ASV15 TaxID=3241295 RepID=UPI0035116DF4
MPTPRAELKSAIIDRLNAVCQEHPMGHQGAYANRYIFKGENGTTTEILFEKSDRSPANLWVLETLLAPAANAGVSWKSSPASKLYQSPGANGKMKYGRHSALEKMDILGKADLACVNLSSVQQLDRILDALDAA